MRKKIWITRTLFSVISAGALALGSYTFTVDHSTGSLPIPGAATQAAYEAEVAVFLESHPEPSQSDFGNGVENQNAYWRAQAAWWRSVPWDAVAGQWGCTTGSVNVSLNPATRDGVVTAGYGGSGDCGGYYDREFASTFSEPRTRTMIVAENPGLSNS